ncbi:MAG: redoxin domain-containing protein, partial [Phycisphaerae bacterium]
ANLPGRFQLLVDHYADDPTLDDVLPQAVFAGLASDKPASWADALSRLAATAKRKEAKVAALMALGKLRLGAKEPSEAKTAFQRVLTMKPGEETAQAARGYIHEIDHLQIGMPAPPFTAKTLDGKTVSLKSLHGQVVLLDFWASWCAPCIAEIPAVKEAVEQLKGKPFTVLAVSLDDDRDDVRRVVKRLKFPGYQTWDEKGWENPVQTLYNVQMIPTWYVIDGRGIIRNRDPFGEKLIPAVRAVLKQHAASRVGHPTDG